MPATTPRRRPLAAALVALVLAALALVPATAAAGAQEATPPVDPNTTAPPVDTSVLQAQQELAEQVSETQQALDNHAKVLRAEAGVVRAEVIRLREAIAAQQAKVAEARVAADAAIEALSAARAARTKAARELKEQRERTKRLAASAYISGPAKINLILQSEDINDAVRRQSMAAAAGDATVKTLRDLDRAERASRRAEVSATAAAQDAASAAAAAEAEADSLADQQSRHTLVLSAVNDRLEHTLSESAALASIDVTAADAIANRDAILRDIAAPSASRPISGLRPSIPSVPTVRVGTITVSAALAPSLQALLDHATRDGFAFGGGGFRDPTSQIALRVLHCGPTDYDIYEKPSGECVPPTARPGMSMHEQGLAIDFTVNGRAIISETDPAFIWLATNAATYGLYNLPGEPWHWSTTGS